MEEREQELENIFKEKFAKKVDRDIWKFNYLKALADLETAQMMMTHIENLLGLNIMELTKWKEKYVLKSVSEHKEVKNV